MFDLNCDLGEGVGNDFKIMPWITSCNIACGGHFGDRNTISETISLAKKHNVRVGAHPSYYDHQNFSNEIHTSNLCMLVKIELALNLQRYLIQAQLDLYQKFYHFFN